MEKMTEKKNRQLSVDFVKIIAMVGVMILHSQVSIFDGNPIALAMSDAAVFSIPLFFMTSGYLLLDRNKVSYKYSFHKILGIVRFVLLITSILWLALGMRHGENYLIYTFGCFLQKGGMGVFWYFGAMILIYLFLPLLHSLYKIHKKSFATLTIVLFVISNAVFLLNFFNIHVENATIQTFRLWNWVFYFNMGGLIKEYQVKIKFPIVILLFVVSDVLLMYLTPLMPTIYCEYFYPSLMVQLLSLALFSFAIFIPDDKLKFVCGGSKLLLPCYTFHTFIIGKTWGAFEIHLEFLGVFIQPAFTIFVCISTIGLAWFIMKIPYMDKVFKI